MPDHITKEAAQRAMIYLDISRLLKAGFRTTPSGIERMELAYAHEFHTKDETTFAAALCGTLLVLPHGMTLAYILALGAVWKGSNTPNRARAILLMILLYFWLLARAIRAVFPSPVTAGKSGSIYLNLSHENLQSPRVIADFKSRTGAKAICFVHDLIPITHPEYARPGQARIHRRRINTAAELSDALLVNSQATKDELLRYLHGKPCRAAIHVAHLGIANGAGEPTAHDRSEAGAAPYFLCLATIEPRKNHLLLLHLWRGLIAENAKTPRLIIAGRRGWENEMVIDMLERCEILSGYVEERGGAGDSELRFLMQNATALLLPSFAEGFGLPAAEALSAGTPVICSDLPALREVCGNIPEYLDPLDGIGWRQAILDYAGAASPRRAAFNERLREWSAPRWETHFGLVREVIKDLEEG